jgi:hypothetical protein
MNTGMMWFDNDPKKSLDVKVLQAADYYQHKYGRSPDMCMVNPGSLAKSESQAEPLLAGSIVIKPLRSVLPGHLWIGVDEKLSVGAD